MVAITRYVCQVIMLCTFNLHEVVCQLYTNKAGVKKTSGPDAFFDGMVIYFLRELW